MVEVTAKKKANKSQDEDVGSATSKPVKRKYQGKIFLERERCKGCGFCIEFCPAHVLVFDTEMNQKGYHPPRVAKLEVCTGCDLCGIYCPDFAIHAVRITNDKEEESEGVS